MAIDRASHKRRKKGTPVIPDQDPSPAQVDIFFDHFAETLHEYHSRRHAGLSRTQMEALKKTPEFLARYKEMRLDLVDRVKDAAYEQAIVRGNKDLIQMILKAELPELYGPRASVNINIDVERLKAMTKEELMDLRDQLSKAR